MSGSNKYSDVEKIRMAQICQRINEKQLFWIKDLRSEFEIGTDGYGDGHSMLTQLLKELKNKNIIQCSEYSKGERQYIVLRNFDFSELKIGKK